MIAATFALGAVLLCLVALPEILRATTAFDRSPRVGLVLWVALCVVGWLSAIIFFLEVGLDGFHTPLLVAVARFVRHLGDGHPLRGLGLTEVVGLSVAFDILVLLLGALIVASWQNWDVRHQQRIVLDLVARPATRREEYCLIQHSRPLAYFLPGAGGRIVLSTGALDVLSSLELDAVVAHELGHRHGRHGALLVPLQALSPFVAFLPLARYAPAAVRGYLEMTADDFARSRSPVNDLKTALEKSALFYRPPLGTLGAADAIVERRIKRLSSSTTPTRDTWWLVTIVGCCVTLLWALLSLH
ncbi:MAG: M56 family metallopeptidase [Acidimicrobiales bacterium]